jgi:hypothetical protein
MEVRGIMRSLKERRKEKKGFDNLQQYPKDLQVFSALNVESSSTQ